MSNDDDDTIVMYILVNMDLGMKKGKIGSQCAHSACKVVEKLVRYDISVYAGGADNAPYLDTFKEWLSNSYTKIVLKSNEEQMLELIDKYHEYSEFTRDAGRTQIPVGSLTTLAFYPMHKSSARDEIKELKLL